MGFRFSRRIGILPGLSLNLSRSGVSLSAGVRGAHVTLGPRGTYTSVGLPGTGISYRQRIGGGRRLPQAPAMRELDLNATGNRANDELAPKLFQGGRANGFVEHRRGQALSGRSALQADGPPNRPAIDPAAIGSTDPSGRHRGKASPGAGGITVRGRRVSAPDKLLETTTADSFARGLGPGAGKKTVRTSNLCPG